MHGTYARAADRSRRTRRLLAGFAAGCLLACASGAAQARVELVRWRQPDALRAEGFRVHLGTESGNYREEIDVGAPTASAEGVYALLLSVPDASRVYVAVSAYNEAGASNFSNEGVRDAGGEDEEAAAGRDRHRPERSSLGGHSRRRLAVSWPEPAELHASLDPRSAPDTAGLEVRGRLRIDEAGGGIGVTLRAPASGDAFYWLAREPEPGAAFTIASTVSPLECIDALPVPEPGAWYRFRLAVQPDAQETLVAAKVWPSGTREPKAWTGCSDPSPDRLVAAVPGVWAVGAGIKAWDRIKVTRPPK